jgi:predicted  nucleic acid-binding Zn-ribbon protein
MFQEIVNIKDKADKDLEEIMEQFQRSYNELWGKVHVKKQKCNKELHAKDVKLKNLKLIHKTLWKLTNWEKATTKNQTKSLFYEQLVG